MLEAPAKAGRADDLLGPVHRRLDAKAALGRRAGEGLVERAPGRVRRRKQRAQDGRALVGSEPVERRQPAAREVGPWHVERPAHGLPPPYRDDLAAGGEGVQPLGGSRQAGADDGHGARVLVWLVRVHRARIVAQVVRDVQARMAGCQQHVAERAVPVELEAARGRADRLDADDAEALLPAAAAA